MFTGVVGKRFRQAVGAGLGILLGLIIALQAPPAGLTVPAMKALGILAWAVVYWIFEVIPDYVVALLMCSAWVVFKVVPFNVAFATFAGESWWLMVGALGMGVAVGKSGLLRRAALQVMRFFPATFRGQTLAMLSAGILLSPLIPSVTAKSAMVAPFGLAVSDAMGYERKSRGAAGIFAAMYTGFVSIGPMFISASFMGYMMRGLLPADVQAQFTWSYWFIAALPWGLFLLVTSYLAILSFYQPKTEPIRSAAFAAEQLAELDPMNRDEKITLLVLISALLLWITEPLHGISSTLVALVGLSVLLGSGVYGRPDFRTGIPWDSVVFIGGIINLGSVIPYLKIDKWIGQMFGPQIGGLIANFYIFTIALALFIYLARFVLVSMNASIAIFVVLLVPFAVQAGINPWTMGMVVYCSVNVWNAFYQNSSFLVAFYATGGAMVDHSQMVKFSLAYMVISLAGLLLSIPLWKMLGLVP